MTGTRLNRSLVLTPPGAGAIGVVRVCGPDALSILGKMFRPTDRGLRSAGGAARAEACGSLLESDRLRYGWFVVDDEVVDDVVVSRAPTGGPPAFDISAHGGVRVIERILQALERQGAPLCDVHDPPVPLWPTRNLIEQEAVEALARAKTERAVRFLAWQRQHLAPSLERVASLCGVDWERAREALEAMVARSQAARTLIEGATVVILGPPNSGKSTLFNRLLGRSATIVSSRAGTTRDWVTGPAEMNGIPLTLVDTAGWLTSTGDQLEHRAVESGWAIAQQADLCLLLLDGTELISVHLRQARNLQAACRSLPRRLTVINKVDQESPSDDNLLPDGSAGREDPPLRVSARTGAGLDRLAHRILDVLGYDDWVDATPCLFTSRQASVASGLISDLGDRPAAAEAAIRGPLIGEQLGDP